ncbi:hypothetical protein DNU06_04825 [Putridiphycobacter roseus]|uniref:DUF4249 domain-containing protein n=1 Tax=Putridiphycobacter roseus TaxID=2219161 RepID=A0A2W1NJ15_9FLAO|nr:hypothetical protein [Putridiphycobacter roseus]PZE17946.1 hypothetical protein DNU06_04825 [Putridiphycobacter roseus]
MLKNLFIIALFMVAASSCDNKLSLNADYTTTPIIFGLLDPNDTIHYIKITKTFLGDGNNYDFAKVPDSSYFKQVDAKIIELNNGVKTGREWSLYDTTILNKEEGVFYYPSQKVYIFHEANLVEDYDYKLEAIFNEGAYSADATTSLVDGFEYNSNFLNQSKITFANGSGSYSNLFIRYSEAYNATGYQTRLYINYREFYSDNTSAVKQLVWSATSNNGKSESDVNPASPDASAQVSFSGEGFYQFMAASIQENENVTSRQMIDIGVVTEVGHVDLMKYISVGEPNSSLSQTTSLFTNINNGLGLFSSRVLESRTNMPLLPGSIEELCTGTYTNQLKFCSTDPSHTSKFFYCY